MIQFKIEFDIAVDLQSFIHFLWFICILESSFLLIDINDIILNFMILPFRQLFIDRIKLRVIFLGSWSVIIAVNYFACNKVIVLS